MMSVQPLIFDTNIAKDKPENIRHPHNACPFCEPAQLTDILDQEADRIWLMNKFPTLQATWQTLVIETADHQGDIATYPVAQNRAIFQFAIKQWQATIASDRFTSVLLYKNFGPHSGGSLRHPHMQIVGLEAVDGYAHLTPANLSGYPVVTAGDLQVTVSDRPVMGFVEFNVTAAFDAINELADAVQKVVQWSLQDYFNGRCDSYNLFFYPFGDRLVAKVVPLFNVSPYYIGYRLAQADTPERMREIAAAVRQKF
ncbi:integral membrane protein [Lactiplantibacillus fabifermentans DSM 21115]|uniref:Integral membrane protein n=2 Tax=Lactiplantibacillus fabifermentans TaxID=483011 RepID=A0A0R2NRI1_9LACO|nr:integral membrane protein [Lactiplantibacillus fabifermentans DSM 21115]